MHITLLLLYGATIWLALIALALITETGLTALAVLSGPLIISAAVVVLMILDAAIARVWN